MAPVAGGFFFGGLLLVSQFTGNRPTQEPTSFPTNVPSFSPSVQPSVTPSWSPSVQPSTSIPSPNPTFLPSNSPISSSPSTTPSLTPTTTAPTISPSDTPTISAPTTSPEFPDSFEAWDFTKILLNYDYTPIYTEGNYVTYPPGPSPSVATLNSKASSYLLCQGFDSAPSPGPSIDYYVETSFSPTTVHRGLGVDLSGTTTFDIGGSFCQGFYQSYAEDQLNAVSNLGEFDANSVLQEICQAGYGFGCERENIIPNIALLRADSQSGSFGGNVLLTFSDSINFGGTTVSDTTQPVSLMYLFDTETFFFGKLGVYWICTSVDFEKTASPTLQIVAPSGFVYLTVIQGFFQATSSIVNRASVSKCFWIDVDQVGDFTGATNYRIASQNNDAYTMHSMEMSFTYLPAYHYAWSLLSNAAFIPTSDDRENITSWTEYRSNTGNLVTGIVGERIYLASVRRLWVQISCDFQYENFDTLRLFVGDSLGNSWIVADEQIFSSLTKLTVTGQAFILDYPEYIFFSMQTTRDLVGSTLGLTCQTMVTNLDEESDTSPRTYFQNVSYVNPYIQGFEAPATVDLNFGASVGGNFDGSTLVFGATGITDGIDDDYVGGFYIYKDDVFVKKIICDADTVKLYGSRAQMTEDGLVVAIGQSQNAPGITNVRVFVFDDTTYTTYNETVLEPISDVNARFNLNRDFLCMRWDSTVVRIFQKQGGTFVFFQEITVMGLLFDCAVSETILELFDSAGDRVQIYRRTTGQFAFSQNLDTSLLGSPSEMISASADGDTFVLYERGTNLIHYYIDSGGTFVTDGTVETPDLQPDTPEQATLKLSGDGLSVMVCKNKVYCWFVQDKILLNIDRPWDYLGYFVSQISSFNYGFVSHNGKRWATGNFQLQFDTGVYTQVGMGWIFDLITLREEPTVAPTQFPSESPISPSVSPSTTPSLAPTQSPSQAPITNEPSSSPTSSPSSAPSLSPTVDFTWNKQATVPSPIFYPPDLVDPGQNPFWAQSNVAVLSDGSRAAIGARDVFDDRGGVAVAIESNPGSAVFSWYGPSLQGTTINEDFGRSIAFSADGHCLVVVQGGINGGGFYIYRDNGTAYEQTQNYVVAGFVIGAGISGDGQWISFYSTALITQVLFSANACDGTYTLFDQLTGNPSASDIIPMSYNGSFIYLAAPFREENNLEIWVRNGATYELFQDLVPDDFNASENRLLGIGALSDDTKRFALFASPLAGLDLDLQRVWIYEWNGTQYNQKYPGFRFDTGISILPRAINEQHVALEAQRGSGLPSRLYIMNYGPTQLEFSPFEFSTTDLGGVSVAYRMYTGNDMRTIYACVTRVVNSGCVVYRTSPESSNAPSQAPTVSPTLSPSTSAPTLSPVVIPPFVPYVVEEITMDDLNRFAYGGSPAMDATGVSLQLWRSSTAFIPTYNYFTETESFTAMTGGVTTSSALAQCISSDGLRLVVGRSDSVPNYILFFNRTSIDDPWVEREVYSIAGTDATIRVAYDITCNADMTRVIFGSPLYPNGFNSDGGFFNCEVATWNCTQVSNPAYVGTNYQSGWVVTMSRDASTLVVGGFCLADTGPNNGNFCFDVWKSDDGGANWSLRQTQLAAFSVGGPTRFQAIAYVSGDGNTFVVQTGTSSSKVYRYNGFDYDLIIDSNTRRFIGMPEDGLTLISIPASTNVEIFYFDGTTYQLQQTLGVFVNDINTRVQINPDASVIWAGSSTRTAGGLTYRLTRPTEAPTNAPSESPTMLPSFSPTVMPVGEFREARVYEPYDVVNAIGGFGTNFNFQGNSANVMDYQGTNLMTYRIGQNQARRAYTYNFFTGVSQTFQITSATSTNSFTSMGCVAVDGNQAILISPRTPNSEYVYVKRKDSVSNWVEQWTVNDPTGTGDQSLQGYQVACKGDLSVLYAIALRADASDGGWFACKVQTTGLDCGTKIIPPGKVGATERYATNIASTKDGKVVLTTRYCTSATGDIVCLDAWQSTDGLNFTLLQEDIVTSNTYASGWNFLAPYISNDGLILTMPLDGTSSVVYARTSTDELFTLYQSFPSDYIAGLSPDGYTVVTCTGAGGSPKIWFLRRGLGQYFEEQTMGCTISSSALVTAQFTQDSRVIWLGSARTGNVQTCRISRSGIKTTYAGDVQGTNFNPGQFITTGRSPGWSFNRNGSLAAFDARNQETFYTYKDGLYLNSLNSAGQGDMFTAISLDGTCTALFNRGTDQVKFYYFGELVRTQTVAGSSFDADLSGDFKYMAVRQSASLTFYYTSEPCFGIWIQTQVISTVAGTFDGNIYSFSNNGDFFTKDSSTSNGDIYKRNADRTYTLIQSVPAGSGYNIEQTMSEGGNVYMTASVTGSKVWERDPVGDWQLRQTFGGQRCSTLSSDGTVLYCDGSTNQYGAAQYVQGTIRSLEFESAVSGFGVKVTGNPDGTKMAANSLSAESGPVYFADVNRYDFFQPQGSSVGVTTNASFTWGQFLYVDTWGAPRITGNDAGTFVVDTFTATTPGAYLVVCAVYMDPDIGENIALTYWARRNDNADTWFCRGSFASPVENQPFMEQASTVALLAEGDTINLEVYALGDAVGNSLVLPGSYLQVTRIGDVGTDYIRFRPIQGASIATSGACANMYATQETRGASPPVLTSSTAVIAINQDGWYHISAGITNTITGSSSNGRYRNTFNSDDGQAGTNPVYLARSAINSAITMTTTYLRRFESGTTVTINYFQGATDSGTVTDDNSDMSCTRLDDPISWLVVRGDGTVSTNTYLASSAWSTMTENNFDYGISDAGGLYPSYQDGTMTVRAAGTYLVAVEFELDPTGGDMPTDPLEFAVTFNLGRDDEFRQLLNGGFKPDGASNYFRVGYYTKFLEVGDTINVQARWEGGDWKTNSERFSVFQINEPTEGNQVPSDASGAAQAFGQALEPDTGFFNPSQTVAWNIGITNAMSFVTTEFTAQDAGFYLVTTGIAYRQSSTSLQPYLTATIRNGDGAQNFNPNFPFVQNVRVIQPTTSIVDMAALDTLRMNSIYLGGDPQVLGSSSYMEMVRVGALTNSGLVQKSLFGASLGGTINTYNSLASAYDTPTTFGDNPPTWSSSTFTINENGWYFIGMTIGVNLGSPTANFFACRFDLAGGYEYMPNVAVERPAISMVAMDTTTLQCQIVTYLRIGETVQLRSAPPFAGAGFASDRYKSYAQKMDNPLDYAVIYGASGDASQGFGATPTVLTQESFPQGIVEQSGNPTQPTWFGPTGTWTIHEDGYYVNSINLRFTSVNTGTNKLQFDLLVNGEPILADQFESSTAVGSINSVFIKSLLLKKGDKVQLEFENESGVTTSTTSAQWTMMRYSANDATTSTPTASPTRNPTTTITDSSITLSGNNNQNDLQRVEAYYDSSTIQGTTSYFKADSGLFIVSSTEPGYYCFQTGFVWRSSTAVALFPQFVWWQVGEERMAYTDSPKLAVVTYDRNAIATTECAYMYDVFTASQFIDGGTTTGTAVSDNTIDGHASVFRVDDGAALLRLQEKGEPLAISTGTPDVTSIFEIKQQVGFGAPTFDGSQVTIQRSGWYLVTVQVGVLPSTTDRAGAIINLSGSRQASSTGYYITEVQSYSTEWLGYLNQGDTFSASALQTDGPATVGAYPSRMTAQLMPVNLGWAQINGGLAQTVSGNSILNSYWNATTLVTGGSTPPSYSGGLFTVGTTGYYMMYAYLCINNAANANLFSVVQFILNGNTGADMRFGFTSSACNVGDCCRTILYQSQLAASTTVSVMVSTVDSAVQATPMSTVVTQTNFKILRVR